MGAVRVTTPGGAIWTVRRRWLPHRDGIGPRARWRRHRERRGSGSDWSDGFAALDFGSDVAGVAVVIGLVLAIILVIVFGWPLVLIGIDLVWLLLVGIFGTIGRVVLRRPWRVEARSGDERRDWYVQGFRQSGRHRDEIARQLRHGQNPLGDGSAALTH